MLVMFLCMQVLSSQGVGEEQGQSYSAVITGDINIKWAKLYLVSKCVLPGLQGVQPKLTIRLPWQLQNKKKLIHTPAGTPRSERGGSRPVWPPS